MHAQNGLYISPLENLLEKQRLRPLSQPAAPCEYPPRNHICSLYTTDVVSSCQAFSKILNLT